MGFAETLPDNVRSISFEAEGLLVTVRRPRGAKTFTLSVWRGVQLAYEKAGFDSVRSAALAGEQVAAGNAPASTLPAGLAVTTHRFPNGRWAVRVKRDGKTVAHREGFETEASAFIAGEALAASAVAG